MNEFKFNNNWATLILACLLSLALSFLIGTLAELGIAIIAIIVMAYAQLQIKKGKESWTRPFIFSLIVALGILPGLLLLWLANRYRKVFDWIVFISIAFILLSFGLGFALAWLGAI